MKGSCPLCGEVSAEPLFETGGRALVRCRTCALVFYDPLPGPGELDALYHAGYFRTGRGCARSEREDASVMEGILARLERERPAKGRLLDVGCSQGLLLALAQKRGWRGAGVEVSPKDASEARQTRGLEVFCGPVEKAPWPAGSFEAVTLLDVIEHLVDPLPALQAIRELLSEGGLLVAVTGNVESRRAKRLGAGWGYLARPGHVVFWAPGTVRRALDLAGFRTVRVELSLVNPTWDQRIAPRALHGLRGLANRYLAGPKSAFKRALERSWVAKAFGGEGMLVLAEAP